MDAMFQDLRYGLRSLVKSPLTTGLAILSLGLGIGATATIFSPVDVFMIRPLPFPEAERLIQVWSSNPERGWTTASLSIPDILDYREQSRTMDIAGYRGWSYNLSGTDEPERLQGERVLANFFDVLGIDPAYGRGFLREEEASGRDRVTVLSHELWVRRFGGEVGILGRRVLLDEEPYTVVGIMPPKLPFPFNRTDLWTPAGISGEEPRPSRSWSALGRLGNGATLEQARAEMTELARGLEEAHPEDNAGMGTTLVPLREEIFDEGFHQGSAIASVAVLLVLLIACANVANLLLARTLNRDRELALRAALGAGRGRIVRQLLTESTILGIAGGVLGVLLAIWGMKGLVSVMPAWFPRVEDIRLDGRVLAFTGAVAVLSGIVVGLIPSLQVSHRHLRDSLTEGGRGSTTGVRRGRLRSSLAVSQMSLALVLLIAAVLLVRSFVALGSVDMGFRTEDVLSFRLSLPDASYSDEELVARFYDQLLPAVDAVPGVASAAATNIVPASGWGSGTYYRPEAESYPEGQWPVIQLRQVTPGYFRTMDIALVRGRAFTDADRAGSPGVMVINESAAERHWPDEDPIGERVEFSSGFREIVGVVEDILAWGPESDPAPMAYWAAAQSPNRGMALVLRTEGDAAGVTSGARQAVRELNPNLPVYAVQTIEEMIREETGGQTIMVKILAVLAVVALILAVVGVYGVMAYSVAQRVHETGVRMALGAQAADILRLIVGQGARLTVLAVAVGVLVSLGVMKGLSFFLFGVSSFDLPTFAGMAITILLAGLAASWLPARRAARVDPMVALRTE